MMENLINKRCLLDGCYKTFKSFPSSKRRFCDVKCEMKWHAKNNTAPQPTSDERNETVNPSAENISPTKSFASTSSRSEKQPITPTSQESDLETEPTTISTEPEVQSLQLSDDSVRTFETGALGCMTLLHRSGNRLLRLMGESVNKMDLEKSKEGVQRVESQRIQQTIDLANALAHTMQVQANLLKSLTSLTKERS